MFNFRVVKGPYLKVKKGETVTNIYNPLNFEYALQNDGIILNIENQSTISHIINNGEIVKLRNLLGAPIEKITNTSHIRKLDNEGSIFNLFNYDEIKKLDNHGGFIDYLRNESEINNITNRVAERLGFDNSGEIDYVSNYGHINHFVNEEDQLINNVLNVNHIDTFENKGTINSFSNTGKINQLIIHKIIDDTKTYANVIDTSPLAIKQVA